MPRDQQQLTRADLPEELTPDTIRELPLNTLRRLSRPGNGVLSLAEQETFDAALHEVMSGTARRLSRQINKPEWAALREADTRGSRRGGPGRPSGVDEYLRRVAKRIDEQVDVAQALAPGVDWSFAHPAEGQARPESTATPEIAPPPESSSAPDLTDSAETVADLEQRLTEQVELVEVMSEIAEVSKRTYALEQQRDLQSTRSVFFGFVVSVAVLVAGWAPIVAADDWAERFWVLGLTVGTCVLAGMVYSLIRGRQTRRQSDAGDEEPAT